MKDLNQELLLHSIIELKECDDYQVVNEYLKLGWILISTHLTDSGHPVERHQKTNYCIGWNIKLGKPNHKIPKVKRYTKRDGY